LADPLCVRVAPAGGGTAPRYWSCAIGFDNQELPGLKIPVDEALLVGVVDAVSDLAKAQPPGHIQGRVVAYRGASGEADDKLHRKSTCCPCESALPASKICAMALMAGGTRRHRPSCGSVAESEGAIEPNRMDLETQRAMRKVCAAS